MPVASRIDLEPYGLHLVLRKGVSTELESLDASRLYQGSFSRTQGRFDLHSGTYSMGPELGRGTYGITYQAIHTMTNQVYLIKVIHLNRTNLLQNTIKECIIQILLEKASEKEFMGPFVPRLYEIAYDPVRNNILLRMERLHGDLRSIYLAATPEQNDIIIPQTVGNLAHILNFFYEKLKFNHRDLKADNVAYVLTPKGDHIPKLIDFGMSCVTWNGIRIAGASYFRITDKCYIPTRDMTQFLFELLVSRYPMTPRLNAFIKDLLTFPIDKGTCKLYEGCKYKRREVGRLDWNNIYEFLNSHQIKNPNGVPAVTYRRMLEFLGQHVPKLITPITPTEDHRTPPIKHCLPEQILNPKTRRCVKRDGKVGRQILRETELLTPTPTRGRTTRGRRRVSATSELAPCKPGQSRNPKTRRCRKACERSQIRDPATGRCVSRKGAIGRRVKAQGAITSPMEA